MVHLKRTIERVSLFYQLLVMPVLINILKWKKNVTGR